MNNKLLLTILMVLVTSMFLFAGCGANDSDDTNSSVNGTTNNATNNDTNGTTNNDATDNTTNNNDANGTPDENNIANSTNGTTNNGTTNNGTTNNGATNNGTTNNGTTNNGTTNNSTTTNNTTANNSSDACSGVTCEEGSECDPISGQCYFNLTCEGVTLQCNDFLNCYQYCSDDSACIQGCFGSASTECQQCFGAFQQCAQSSGCVENNMIDAQCAAENCNTPETKACVGAQSAPIASADCPEGTTCQVIQGTNACLGENGAQPADAQTCDSSDFCGCPDGQVCGGICLFLCTP